VSDVANMLFRDGGVTIDDFSAIIDRACAYESRYIFDRLDRIDERIETVRIQLAAYEATILQMNTMLIEYKDRIKNRIGKQ
jgi:hypothetical protein